MANVLQRLRRRRNAEEEEEERNQRSAVQLLRILEHFAIISTPLAITRLAIASYEIGKCPIAPKLEVLAIVDGAYWILQHIYFHVRRWLMRRSRGELRITFLFIDWVMVAALFVLLLLGIFWLFPNFSTVTLYHVNEKRPNYCDGALFVLMSIYVILLFPLTFACLLYGCYKELAKAMEIDF